MVNCLVVNCHNTYKNTKGKGVSFHKLPVNEMGLKPSSLRLGKIYPPI